ncbi:hypothetical protein SHELI_v1c04000 [Spiroplasma helicoides]|uniref:Uncharacterized protein n=1 Tax=Spiroplasma helicoides TaxID=216938 RepID=A0A1B3SK98_9MOLU|nr:hypothetical protein [Spiroplasma helicoides]AOG60351.1 hypothetical protein SHELI_v1c04000 [Spiroplasma helicoides]
MYKKIFKTLSFLPVIIAPLKIQSCSDTGERYPEFFQKDLSQTVKVGEMIYIDISIVQPRDWAYFGVGHYNMALEDDGVTKKPDILSDFIFITGDYPEEVQDALPDDYPAWSKTFFLDNGTGKGTIRFKATAKGESHIKAGYRYLVNENGKLDYGHTIYIDGIIKSV